MSNTGTGCITLMEVTKRIDIIPVYDSTGARNYIDLTGQIDQAMFTALINQSDDSKRLYPLPVIKDIDDQRADPIMEKTKDDASYFIREGIRSFVGYIMRKDASMRLKGAIEAARCGEVGVYLVDRLGNYIGIVSDDKTKLYPIRLDSDSISATLVKTTDTTVQKLKLMFNFSPDESDTCLGMISSTEMGDATPLLFKGLIDVYMKIIGSITTTGFAAKLYTDFGTPITPEVLEGVTTPDFVSSDDAATSQVYNQTDDANVAVTATEQGSPDEGTYDLAFAAQTSNDVIIVDLKKNGFDFTNVRNSPVTIP